MNLPRLIDGGRSALLARLVANGLGQATAAVAAMFLTRAIFDRLWTGADPSSFGVPATALVATALVSALLVLRERIDAERLGQSVAREIRSLLFKRLTRAWPRALQRRSRGGLTLRLSTDVAALRQWASFGVARLCVAGIAGGVTLAALAAMSRTIALVVAAVLGCGALLSTLIGKPLATAIAEARRRRAYLAANVAEKVSAIAVLQVHHGLRREQRRLDRQGRRLETAMLARGRWIGVLHGVSEGTGRLAAVAALVVGTLEVAAGIATPGVVVAAVGVAALLGPAVRDLGRAFELWSKARQARAELSALLRLGKPVRGGARSAILGRGDGALEFAGVAFAPALGDFTGCVAARSRVAIVGPNGSGKSTLLWLAARLLDPERGRILLDGHDLGTLSLRSLRRSIGIAGDGLPLLRGTIRDNVTYRWPKASAADIEDACRWSGLDKTLARLQAGLDTRLGDRAANLSEGERQSVALARAVLGRPRLLLLDEIEANLDARSRADIATRLRNYPGTVLLVTHDREWLRSADVVWHVAGGALVETGPPSELLRGTGPTAHAFDHLRVVS